MSASLGAARSGDVTAPAAPSSPAARRFTALRYCAGVYFPIRIGLFLISAAAWGLTGDDEFGRPRGRAAHLHNGWHNAVSGWIRLDTTYFLAIARHGYESQRDTSAFFPAYPALIRVASYVCFGNYWAAALVVSNAALLAALVVLYRLTQREYDEATARRAVLYLCLLPTAIFLFNAYSEALFLLAAVGAIALARSGHWGWAGLLGLVGALTRSTGVVIALALAAEAIHQTVAKRRAAAPGAGWRQLAFPAAGRLAASAVPVLGPVGYLAFWQLQFHKWAYPLQVEKTVWDRVPSWPWVTLWRGLTLAVSDGPLANHAWTTFDFVLVAAGLLLAVWVAFRCRPVYVVFCWGSIVFFLVEMVPTRPLGSDPRYLVVIFPLAWALARLGRDPRGHEAIVAVSAASMAVTAWLFLTTFSVI